jgi:transcriptional regulator CBF1
MAGTPPPQEHEQNAAETAEQEIDPTMQTDVDQSQGDANVDDVNGSTGQGGLDRDVNSILANLNQEQLASIVAAARASEGGANGDYSNTSGVDASSILAALPPHLGQAASALTSFASSFKRDQDEGEQREDGNAENQHVEHGEQGENQPEAHAEQSGQVGEEDKKEEDFKDEHHQYDETNPDDSLAQTTEPPGDQTTDDYRNENATQAAIAAMESLAAQTGLHLQDQNGKGGRAKRDTGPEAERLRKDQHKEVERKRREQISNGITELAAIVPGCDAKGINKTAIINAAVRYIMELKNNEASNIEKWTLEKLLMDQAMGDLNAQLEAHRKELSRLRAELGLPDEPLEEPQQYTEGGEEQGLEQHQQNGEQMEGVEGGEEHQEANDEAIDPNLDPETAQAKDGAVDGAGTEGAEITEAVNDSKAQFAGKDPKIHLREEEEEAVNTTAAAQEDGGDRAKRSRNA